MITPVLKDEILTDLIVRSPKMSFDGSLYEFAERFNVAVEVVDSIMEQFRKRGFITYQETTDYGVFMTIHAEAHDYVLKGWFLGEYEYLEAQVFKLEKELDSLKGKAPAATFDRMKGLLDTVLSAVQAYNSFK